MTTLDEILQLARDPAPPRFGEAVKLAAFVADVLGVAWPCGWPQPVVEDPAVVNCGGKTRPHIYWEGTTYTRAEALGIAAGLVRAALQLVEES
jgi:hypothetical protein